MASSAAQPISTLDPLADRVISVDVLRGFDMFWIVGGGHIVEALSKCGDNPVIALLVKQLTHVDWEGFVFFDLIFPLFLFLMGMAVVFSVGKIVANEGKAGAYRRILRRFAIMFLLGIIYYLDFSRGIDGVRLLGVLQRLALCYLCVSIMYVHLKPKQMAIVCVALLVGYWAWLSFVPVPGLGKASFERGANWANYVDKVCLPLNRAEGTWDPEGILSTLPAVGTCLLGFFAGLFMKDPRVPAVKKGLYFIGAGAVIVIAGYAWGLQFPVIKKIWTSSFVLVSGGYSCLLLGVFYQVVDVWKIRAWTTPFLWIGSNSLAIYMIPFQWIPSRLLGTDGGGPQGGIGTVAVPVISLGLVLLFAEFMYRKKIFIRI